MIKRLGLILVALVMSLTVILSPALADDGGKSNHKVGDKVALSSGDEAVYLGISNGKEIWQATLGDPKYVKGTNIPYDCQWHLVDGNYVAGANDFTATVSSKGVSITYKSKTSTWSPDTLVDKVKAKEKSANPELLAIDPINANYRNNTLMWDYNNGVKRYLRIIEGMLIEYYKIEKPLSADFSIENNLIKDIGFSWFRPASAWDANGEPIALTLLGNHNLSLTKDKVVKTKSNKDIVYPITIDPDVTFYTSSSDGNTFVNDVVYNTAWAATDADSVADTEVSLRIGQWTGFGWFEVLRSGVYFDTSSLPDACNITSSTLGLYGKTDASATDFLMTIQNGQPTYPHDPMVSGDHNKANYSGDGGTFNTSGFNTTGYNSFSLNATGISWISKTGTTKFFIRSSRDISGTQPTGAEYVNVYSYEQGVGYRPKLVVTYAIVAPSIQVDTASNIATTSARLNATVLDDGYESCRVRFGYGNVTQTAPNFNSYQNITAWSAFEWDTGEHPYYDATSMNSSTTYFYRAQIDNSASNVTSANEITFPTLAAVSVPTNFRAYPSQTSVSLSWVKGIGSTQTMVRYSGSSFPTTNTSGTQVYFGIASTAPHIGLTAGHTYYYSAWGESGGSWNATYATVAATTSAFTVSAGDDFEAPTAWVEWFQAPDYTRLSNLEPIYSAVNELADSFGMPRNTTWVSLISVIIAIVSIGLMTTRGGFMAGMVVGGAMMLGGIAIHILPAWMMLFVVLFSILGWALNQRGVGTE